VEDEEEVDDVDEVPEELSELLELLVLLELFELLESVDFKLSRISYRLDELLTLETDIDATPFARRAPPDATSIISKTLHTSAGTYVSVHA